MQTLKTYFGFPILVSIVTLLAVYLWGGVHALFFALILSALEVTLSFDNAVVNAKILSRMSLVWQKRFLTWGILVAVFGTRLVLPILIVSATVFLSPLAVAILAFSDPKAYAEMLAGAGAAIGAFGGAFLLMVSLKYFFDSAKQVHWIRVIERHLVEWGRIEAIEIAIALGTILGLSFLAQGDQTTILSAGIIGILLFIVFEGVASSLTVESKDIAEGGLALFLYLNVLDSAFSLDGVIGAFAITKEIIIIVVGLGIGAYFVRSLTVYFVRMKTLETLKYLEHGAHWAIFGLALSMFAGLLFHIPEIVVGLVGLVFVGLAYFSSIRERKEALTHI